MSTTNLGGRVVAILSSLRLAVVTMLTLGSVAAFATFYEMRHGTPAVQRDLFGALRNTPRRDDPRA